MVSPTAITLRMWLETIELPTGLNLVIEAFADGAIDIGATMRRAPITGMTGLVGAKNVQGENVATMDQYSNERMKSLMKGTGVVHGYVSEEEEKPTFFGLGAWDVYADPLDGSSGIPVGVPVGSIWAVYEHKGPYNDQEALLRPGREMTVAAYALYGSCTSLVIGVEGQGVQMFTLDPEKDAFILTHPDVRFPGKVEYESVNWAYEPKWSLAFRQAKEAALPKKRSGRYIGGLVPDFHRNLLRGGVFFYPADSDSPNGKLRVMYEVAPIAKIAAAAGGRATTGEIDVLDLIPTSIHARTPVIVGPEPNIIGFEQTVRLAS